MKHQFTTDNQLGRFELNFSSTFYLDEVLAPYGLPDLYLSNDLAKEMFISRKKEIELSITGLENESRDLKSRLDVETLTPERIKDIHDIAARTRQDFEVVEADLDPKVTGRKW